MVLEEKGSGYKALILEIQFELKRFFDRVNTGFNSDEDKLFLVELEARNRNILVFQEKEARKKSRALWLLFGNDNMPYFHKFVAHRKNINTIWKIHDDSGKLVEGAEAIAEAEI